MAETLGMLCDKLTIVKLKQYHTDDELRLVSLGKQSVQLQTEIDEFVENAIAGNISSDKLTFASNKVFKKEQNETGAVEGSIAEIFSMLADVNCKLWHEQEKVYEFEKVPADQKDKVVKQLAILNLERNNCIDKIDLQFAQLIRHKFNSK
jgi:hypothetical protein